jgi:ABC-type Fe3+-siderophore transport system permease subunit
MIEFPVSSSDLLGVTALAFFVAVAVQVVKGIKQFNEERAYNAIALGLAVIVALTAALVSSAFRPDAETLFRAVIGAVFASALATFGYETIVNLAGLVGHGPRSDKARRAPLRK